MLISPAPLAKLARTLTLLALLLAPCQTATAQEALIGEIRMFAGNFAPVGWEFCNGQLLPISQYEALFAAIGTTYGGDGQSTFALPDLRGRIPIGQGQGPGLSTRTMGETGGSETVTLTTNQMPAHTHATQAMPADPREGDTFAPAGKARAKTGGGEFDYASSANATSASVVSTPSGGGQPHENMAPFQAVNFIIATEGVFPGENFDDSEPFIGEIRLFPYNFTPRYWAPCDGGFMAIQYNIALFSLLGTNYGGNGTTYFALPNLQNQVALHAGYGSGPGLTPRVLGEIGGLASVTLTTNQMPAHAHATSFNVSNGPGDAATPAGRYLAATKDNAPDYASSATPDVNLGPVLSFGFVGGTQPHNNMPPFLAMRYFIATQGIFPTRP